MRLEKYCGACLLIIVSLLAIACTPPQTSLGSKQPDNSSAALSPNQVSEVPCTSGEKGQGSVEQQKCLGQHIPGFGGYYYISRCEIVIYLTDLEHKKDAEGILVPFSKAMSPECGNRITLDIREGQYEFTELLRWSNMAATLLLFDEKTKVPGVGGMPQSPFFNNRLNISVEKEDTIPLVLKVLRDHDIPQDAFIITSREAERKALASISIAPKIRHGDSDELVVVPVMDWEGKKAAELIMGKSSLDEVMQILPPFPGHGPGKMKSTGPAWLTPELQQVLKRVKRIYNPAMTQTIVGFDRKNILIFSHTRVAQEQAERLVNELDNLSPMRDLHRNFSTLVMEGKLTPCLVIHTTAGIEENKKAIVNGVTYFFTCKTK